MALPGVLLVRLRALCNVAKCVHTGCQTACNGSRGKRYYGTNPGSFQELSTAYSQSKRDDVSSDLLKEFPDPKTLLHSTISRSLRVSDLSKLIQYSCTNHAGVKKATVTLMWPSKIEEEGYASKRIDAERFAAAAVCLKLREMGVIGPNNQLPERSTRKRKRALHSFILTDCRTDDVHVSRPNELSSPVEGTSNVSEALSLFPHPKALLTRVIQVATSSHSLQNVMQLRTTGGKLKTCELTLLWPEKMTFTATASNQVTAEKRVTALACMKLKELDLLDKDNKPLTHAIYHKDKVREAGEKDNRPFPLEIPEYVMENLRKYLAEYPVATELQKLWEEDESREQHTVNEEEEMDYVSDPITGRRYKPLSEQQAQKLNIRLQEQWERANPELNVELPVDSHRDRVLSAVQSSRVIVIAGETGCGKTTRIPRFLLEEHVRGGEGAECNVLVTQPRRISAVSVAQRVGQEIGPALKHCVGYQVRLESRPPEQSGGAMLFLTVGVLLKKLQGNPTLKGISHVVVDEVHERDINTDLLLALLRSSLKENPNLRVVLMSATGDNQKLAQYFGDCPIVKVPGFMHPVQDKYLEDVLREMGRRPQPHWSMEKEKDLRSTGMNEVTLDVDFVADVIEHIDKHGPPGAMLCFLPGWQEIKAVQEKLMEKQHFSSGSQRILPLHSSLSVTEQQVVFQHPPVGQRKIVLTTNIAETSITIDDVVHVVDAGTHKEQNYDPRTKVSCLDTVWVSRSNVTQRKGRAGRCQPGQSYHLFPRKQLDSMTPFPIPEILRTPLENLVLQAKVHSPNLKALDFLAQVLDSPEHNAVRDAVHSLQDIGVLDKTETLTALGQRVACMSCDPRLGKMLVLSSMFRCVLPMISVAACLTRDPFHNSMQNRPLVVKAKEALSGSSHSDYLVFSRAVLGWRRHQSFDVNREDRDEYLQKHTLSRFSLRFINGLVSQFSDNLFEAGLVSRASDCRLYNSLYNEHSHQDELLKAVLLAGLYPNLIQVKKGAVNKAGRFHPNALMFRTLTGTVQLHRSSVNRGLKNLPSRWLTFFSAVKSNGVVFIRDSSAVHPLALLLLTDGDIAEKVIGDKVEVSFPGRSLVCCELSVDTWELLWDLRTSIQTMLHRNLTNPGSAGEYSSQDGKIISLLVQLLNNTESNPFAQNQHSDSEVD